MRTDFKWHLFDLQKSYNDFFKNSILIIIIKLGRTILWQSQMKWWFFFSSYFIQWTFDLILIKSKGLQSYMYHTNKITENFIYYEMKVRFFAFRNWKWGFLFSWNESEALCFQCYLHIRFEHGHQLLLAVWSDVNWGAILQEIIVFESRQLFSLWGGKWYCQYTVDP